MRMKQTRINEPGAALRGRDGIPQCRGGVFSELIVWRKKRPGISPAKSNREDVVP